MNIDKKFMKLPVYFEKIESVSSEDTRFTKVKIFLMHLGQNFNGSVFTKSVVEKAIPTLQYIPIVGFIEENQFGEKDFSDHRYIEIWASNGEYEEKYLGVAYGVIVSNNDNNAHFETMLCDDGVEREFLVVEGLLWNMFKDSKMIMTRDFRKGHSMELWNPDDSQRGVEETNPIDGYFNDEGLFVFTKFSFRAACILGDQYEPAMINSSVVMNNSKFTMADFLKKMQSEINDKFNKFAKLQENLGKGGMEMADVENKKQKVGKEDDTIVVVEDTETETEETGTQTGNDNTNTGSNESTGSDTGNESGGTTGGDDTSGDDTTGDDTTNSNTESGTTEGDNTEENGTTTENTETTENGETGDGTNDGTETNGTDESGETGETGDGDGDGDGGDDTGNTDYQVEYTNLKKEYDKLKAKYQTVVNELDEIKPKYEQYQADEKEREKVELDAAKDAVFTKFVSILGDNPDFIELQNRKAELSLEDIKNKCNSIYADVTISKHFNKKDNSNSLGLLDENDTSDDKYYYSERYGVIRKH